MKTSAAKTPAVSVDQRWDQLGHLVAALDATPLPPEDDPQAVAAYYAAAETVLEQIRGRPATTVEALKVKAEAIAWCCASRSDFGLGETTDARLMASLLRDLLAA